MRELTDHKVHAGNDTLTVAVLDEPGSGFASHLYLTTGFNSQTNASDPFVGQYGTPAVHAHVLFQNGPIGEVGPNGVTHEVLLAIVADRLRCFQTGPFKTRYNALALTHIEEAQNWLNRRTLDRMQRGVEGTHKI